MIIETEIYNLGEQHFNMVGQCLPRQVLDTGIKISNRVVERIYPYALRKLKSAGFDHCCQWKPSIYTIDERNSSRVADRIYCVRWIN